MPYQDWPKSLRCTIISLWLCLLSPQQRTFPVVGWIGFGSDGPLNVAFSIDLKGPVLPGGSNKLKVRFFGGAVAGASCSRYAPSLETGVMEYRRETG